MTPHSIDLRIISPMERHPVVFGNFDRLPPGEALEILVDHDPAPLRNQFESLRTGNFLWEYQEKGPQVWKVRISKAVKIKTEGCCGICGNS